MSTAAKIGPGTVVGDFKILRPLGKGAMGAVWVAEQLSTGAERALKVMHPQLLTDAKSVDRFRQEARVAAKLETEHVVKILGAGTDGPMGSPWIAMELLKGKDLATVAKERGALPPSEVKELFRQLCAGMAVAHRSNIVHRDLKLENIFIADAQRADVPFTVKILDFGISKVNENLDAAMTAAIGSPMWMAPEQAKKGSVTTAADIWPLGLIAFRLLTGRSYWKSAVNERPPVREVLMEVIVAPLDPPSVRAREFGLPDALPAGFDEWFLKCVVRDPAARFTDASSALEALIPVLDGVSARPAAPPVVAPEVPVVPPIAAPVAPPIAPPIAAPVAPPVAERPAARDPFAATMAAPGGAAALIDSLALPPTPPLPPNAALPSSMEATAKLDPNSPALATPPKSPNLGATVAYSPGSAPDEMLPPLAASPPPPTVPAPYAATVMAQSPLAESSSLRAPTPAPTRAPAYHPPPSHVVPQPPPTADNSKIYYALAGVILLIAVGLALLFVLR